MMSDLSAAQVIADFIETLDGHDEVCDCGRPEVHILFALAAAGYAVTKLPEATVCEYSGTRFEHNHGGLSRGGAVRVDGNYLAITGSFGGTPEYCRSLAAALLAAANAAESAS